MREPLRGMLSDDPAKRWSLEDLEMWLNGRRLSLMQPALAERAQRPFRFEGKKYYCCLLSRLWLGARLEIGLADGEAGQHRPVGAPQHR